MLARFKARVLLLGDSAGWWPASSSGSVRLKRLAESARERPPNLLRAAPFAPSALLGGGEGDREDDEIHDLFAKSANDSTVLGLSNTGAGGGASTGLLLSSGTPTTTTSSLGGTSDFGRGGTGNTRTSGLNFELGIHDRGRSIIELLRAGRSSGCWATMATVGGARLSLLPSAGERRAGAGVGFGFVLPKANTDSNSAISKEGTSNAGRLGNSLLMLLERCRKGFDLEAAGGGGGEDVCSEDKRSGVEWERPNGVRVSTAVAIAIARVPLISWQAA